jgi:hypothetical protein
MVGKRGVSGVFGGHKKGMNDGRGQVFLRCFLCYVSEGRELFIVTRSTNGNNLGLLII